MASKKRGDDDVNEKAFLEVKDLIAAVPEDKTGAINIDLGDAANAGLVLVDRARKGDRETVLAKLAPAFIEAGLVAKLEKLCRACLYIADHGATESATAETTMVDVVVADKATATKRRMLKTIEYVLESSTSVMQEVASIKLGTGYLDLASDLVRLAKLYEVHQKALSADTINYRASDLAEARNLAEEVRKQHRASKSRDSELGALRPKAMHLLGFLFDEVKDAARFAFRHQPSALDDFEAMRTLAGVSTRRAPREAAGEVTPEEVVG